ncbi:small GTP-binding protein, putative [Trichomonas vaginalis G3]|uniref:Small GTP-binding protein, putative n=1 Tax=Trichomonas vaginalis (strain ATCC PRA-98 / G3) TaxID=412133 RepID=A2ESY7_TRIV3|nr:GTPase protein [Trichomonas vaginalis G3]EAY04245.1 small GTP-binding protein, putative [Trichomonas vaginalis G3]KAI5550014.1 GTPase protein [Trichomonas vaginalis G3]|eukprot:XP_001316468.1 small GTP-binding protein [Trichomonas vaginalis G3]
MRVKVVLIGDSSVGKTSILMKASRGTFSSDTKPTVGAANAVLDIQVNEQTVSLNIWDTAGQEKYRSLTSMYFNAAGLAIVVFDLTNMASFTVIPNFLSLLRERAGVNVKFVLVGNKSDLSNRQVTYEKATEFAQENNAEFYIETSALSGHRIEELFQRCASLSLPALNTKSLSQPVVEKINSSDQNSSCC